MNPDTIEPRRAAVVRGKAITRDGAPLSGVTVTILNHPEFGQTLSRTDGMFDLAVNGGGVLTVNYAKDGYLAAQRQVNVPWRDFVIAEDVALVPLDPEVTTITASASVPQVARGSTSTDADGTRRATMLFMPGTTATMTLPDGTTRALSTLNVRATEYTVGANGPQAMPAPLPPTSGYTYAVELSVDEAMAAGAKEVTFNQPVIQYVENFLNFPVGQIVPAGYYDRQKAAWMPSDNGKVIKVLGAVGGLAEIDTNGDGSADTVEQLAALEITDTERAQLASLYPAGASLWRVPVTHFTPWDYNWPYGPPEDAKEPTQPEPEKDDEEDNHCKQSGSIIECQNQVLGEKIPIVGTPFSLHYRSDRVPGRKAFNTLRISLSGATLPASLRRIELRIEIAGRNFAFSFPGTPTQAFTYSWDGLDVYGRPVVGLQLVTIRLGYVYPAVYRDPSDLARNFGLPSSTGITRSARSEITLWQSWQGSLGLWDAHAAALGGWTIDVQHHYNGGATVLQLGNGDSRNLQSSNLAITTFAGSGQSDFSGDGGPAREASFNSPQGIAVDREGHVYIADFFNHRIRRVSIDGTITTVAGNGAARFTGDGGPATEASLAFPEAVAVGPDDSLYIADALNAVIRRVSKEGVITTVAGKERTQGFHGDGGPATEAGLGIPRDIAVSEDGTLYITAGHRIRRVSPDGTIATIAGGDVPGFSGDGGPASQALLNVPYGIAIDRSGSVYFVDRGNQRVRKISPDGIIRTVAGNGMHGFSGDGGQAVNARLASPIGIEISGMGTLYIADVQNHRIRPVSADGFITTLAGNGTAASSGDGGPAAQAGIRFPIHVTVDREGNLYASSGDNRVRKISPAFPQFSAEDIVFSSEDGRQLYVFTAEGRHKRSVDAFTGATVYSFGYNSAGRLTTVTDGDGNVTTIERDGAIPVAIVSPDGHRTMLSVDPNGYLANITHPGGESYTMTYSPDGLLTSFTNPRGQTSSFTYDADGRLTKAENAAGGFLSLARATHLNGYVVNEQSTLGRSRTYRVDKLPTGDRQWLNTGPDGTQVQTLFKADGTTITTAADGTTTTAVEGADPRFGMQAPIQKSVTIRTPSGLTHQLTAARSATLSDPNNLLSLQTQTDTVTRNGKTATSVFDAASRQYTATSPQGRQTRTTVDAQGRPTHIEVTGLTPITYGYDPRGRLSTVTQGSGTDARTATLNYNPQGFVGSILDAENRTQAFTYDNAGRLRTQALPDGRVITWSYDANGNVIGITPPGRPEHTFAYTPVDLEQQYTPPAVAGVTEPQTQYTYNLDKHLTTITRPDGRTVQFDYDNAGRLSQVTAPNRTTTYGYHPTTGRLASLNTSDGQNLSYTYEGFLPLSETWSGPITGTVSRTYNNDFLVSGINVNGTNVSFTYDNDDHLTRVGSLTIGRNAQNGLITATSLSAVTTSQTYNPFGEVNQFSASQGSTSLLNITYERDKLGRITEKTETVDSETVTHAHTYDPAGRLTEVRINGIIESTYSYDANGNRLAKSGTAGSYDEQDRLLAYGGNTYSYTANGELQTKTNTSGTTTYAYDVLGNLTNVTLPTGTEIEYVIDGRNRRIGKRVNGVLTRGFLYQDQLNPIAELDGAGNVLSRFVYGTRINVPDYMIRGGTTYRIVSDHLGSPRLVINTTNGNVEQRLDYDEFGNVTLDTNPGFQPFGFAGGIYDQHTKLIRFGARDYDPETGRWTAKDQVRSNERDLNLYVYVQNDPINYFDPNGEASLPAAIGTAAEIVCNAYSLVAQLVGSQREEYDRRVSGHEQQRIDAYNNEHKRAVENCIDQYQVHQNPCLHNNCIDRAGNEHMEKLREEWDRSEQGRANNPWPELPTPDFCPKVKVPGPRAE